MFYKIYGGCVVVYVLLRIIITQYFRGFTKNSIDTPRIVRVGTRITRYLIRIARNICARMYNTQDTTGWKWHSFSVDIEIDFSWQVVWVVEIDLISVWGGGSELFIKTWQHPGESPTYILHKDKTEHARTIFGVKLSINNNIVRLYLVGPFLTTKKITIRDFFVTKISRITTWFFLAFPPKKENHDSRHFVVARHMPDQGTT